MVSPIRDDRFYRRGLVLGLTMAETVILVLFILLLLLGLFIERTNREMRQLASENEELRKRQALVDRFPSEETRIDDLFDELVLLREDNGRLKQSVLALTQKSNLVEGDLARIEAEHEALVAALEESGFPTSDLEALKAKIKDAGSAAAILAEAEKENATLKDYVAYWQRRAGGRSNELPPCWLHPETKKVEYIFDVELVSGGVIVHDRDLAHRREDKAGLPIGSVQFEVILGGPAFLGQTRGLFDVSEERECRFFVRVFDHTGPTEKEIYKKHLSIVEQHFYKYEVRDPNVRPGTV